MTAPIQPSPLAKPLAAPVLRVAAANPSQMVAKALPTDVKGADLQGLQRFQQSLTDVIVPTKRVVKKKVDGEEELSQEQVVVSDSEDYEVAQADTSSAGAAAVSDAGGAAAGGSGAGAGAGAGTAVNLFSPLMFAPLLGLALFDGDNETPAPLPGPEIILPPEPTPEPTPAPRPAPRAVNIAPEVSVEHSDVKLAMNAKAGDIVCAVVSGTDADNGPGALSFFFWENGSPTKASADGYFTIDDNGQISLTSKWQEDVQNGVILPCEASIEMAVVAFDGASYSTPKSITFDIVLPDWKPGAFVDTMYSIGGEHLDDKHHGEDELKIKDEDQGLDLLNLDAQGLDGALSSLEMSRDGNKLEIEIEAKSGEGYEAYIVDQYAPNHSVEFVHFEQGATYGRYDLGGMNQNDVLADCPDAGFFQDHGVYLLSKDSANNDGAVLEGTVCNDVIVGSEDFTEVLYGDEGKDLLFAQQGDTVVGGAGNDLIVIDDECKGDATIQFESGRSNGSDTVVGANHETLIKLGTSVDNFIGEASLAELEGNADVTHELQVLVTEADDSAWEALFPENISGVISLSGDQSLNLHGLLTSDGQLGIDVGVIEVDDENVEGKTLYFLTEEVAIDGTYTHLYEGADRDVSGILTKSEFTLLASFYQTTIDTFSPDSFGVVLPV